MGTGGPRIALAGAVIVGLLSAPASAGAATQIGETFTPTDNCGAITAAQTTSPAGQYTVSSAGVITSWRYQANNQTGAIRFKAIRPLGGSGYAVVGESAGKIPVANTLNSYADIRIPVAAGDVIGLYFAGVAGCTRDVFPGTGYTYGSAFEDVPPGGTGNFTSSSIVVQLDVAATIEPDADNDGFGDETQDACPADEAAQQAPCPVPETQITKHPKDKTKKKTAAFEFTSSIAGATFECSLDGAAFVPCTSPDVLKVKRGKHAFQVRATAKGQTDPSPATEDWKVKKKKRKK